MENNKTKVYLIDGIEFKLKELTLNELDEVNNILQLGKNDNTIESNLTSEDSKKFLSIVIEQVNKKDKNVDIGKCSEIVALEILKDFFLERLKRGTDMKNYFQKLFKKSTII